MALFVVSPEKENQLLARMQALGIRDQDIEEQFVRSSGAGGQKVNKRPPVSCSITDPPAFGSNANKSGLKPSIVFWLDESCWIKSRRSLQAPKPPKSKGSPKFDGKKEGVHGEPSCASSPRSAARRRKNPCAHRCALKTTNELATSLPV
jgi:hypothetical protein